MILKKSEVDAQIKEMEIGLFGKELALGPSVAQGIRIAVILARAYEVDYPREKANLVLAANKLLAERGYYYDEE